MKEFATFSGYEIPLFEVKQKDLNKTMDKAKIHQRFTDEELMNEGYQGLFVYLIVK